ncbi:sigma-70 family RNA polymerase sigma factor [Paraburkholderia jirisanensis]
MTEIDLPGLLPGLLPRLLVFANRLSTNRHDAEDLVQLACVRALERSHQLDRESGVLNWMYTIVRTTWVNEVRTRAVRKRSGVEWDDELLNNIADPNAAPPEQTVFLHQMLGAVRRLPDSQRIVMQLIDVEGFSYQEAAKALDVRTGTIMSRLSRARQNIQEKFKLRKMPPANSRI